MSEIKKILDEIAAEGGSNKKMEILENYGTTPLLKDVIYKALSKRVKFFIKQLPEYTTNPNGRIDLSEALIKLDKISSREVRGHTAIEYLKELLSLLSPDDAYVIERIIDKDLKIGMGTSNINKVFKNLIEKTPYMGAKSFSEDLAKKIFEGGNKGISQVKMDGRYCNAIVRDGEIELESRQGESTYVGQAKFLNDLSHFNDCVLNGELTIDGFDRYTANGIVASVVDIEGKRLIRGEEETAKKIKAFEKKHGIYEDYLSKIRFTIWDMIGVDEYFNKKSSTPYFKRANNLHLELKRVKDIVGDDMKVSFVEYKIVESYEEAMKHFQSILQRGEEGTILKSYDGTWKDGKPNWQVKMKLEMTMDLRIIGFNYGTKGSKNEKLISSLHCESSCGKVKTDPAGINEETMKYITENQESLMGTIVEVQCSGLSKDHDGNWSTLHPRFMKLRDDKNTCDDLASMQAIEDMAKGLKIA